MFWDNWKLVSPNRSPYLDFISLGSARCSNMEMQWMRCAENVGFSNTKKYCEDLHEDYLECLWNVKTKKRIQAIRSERVRQNKPPPQIPKEYL